MLTPFEYEKKENEEADRLCEIRFHTRTPSRYRLLDLQTRAVYKFCPQGEVMKPFEPADDVIFNYIGD